MAINIIELIEEKRCYSCPAHFGGYNGEDYDDGCCINPDYGTTLCLCAFLPRFVVRHLIRKENEKEIKFLNEYMTRKYGQNWEMEV